jgi:hypothetical protein
MTDEDTRTLELIDELSKRGVTHFRRGDMEVHLIPSQVMNGTTEASEPRTADATTHHGYDEDTLFYSAR